MANKQTNASADKSAEVTDNKALLEAKDATIAELKEEVAKKEAAIEDAVNEQISKTESEITDLKDQVAELEKQLKEANAKPTKNDKPVYKGYQFLVDSFRFKGNKHKSVEAVEDESLMKALIEAKFSGLKKVK